MSGQPAQASTEEWCERSDEGHSWSYTHHAGLPRVETRSCMLCGFLSVEPVRELLRAAPAGTGSPTPATDEDHKLVSVGLDSAGRFGVEIEPAERWMRIVAENLIEVFKAAGEPANYLSWDVKPAGQVDPYRLYLCKPGGKSPHELRGEAEAARDAARAEIAEAIAAAGPRGDKPLSVVVAEIVAELSQVREERDAARRAVDELMGELDGFHASQPAVEAAFRERNEARSALAALREQHDRDMESWQQDVNALDELQKAITRATANDGSESDVEAIERIGNEARHHIDRVIDLEDALAALRAEVPKILNEVIEVQGQVAECQDRPGRAGYQHVAYSRLTRICDALRALADPVAAQTVANVRAFADVATRALVTDQSPAAPPDPDPASDHERFPPDGCRYCGWEQRSHGRIWTAADGIGWHSWTPPSDAQRLERMRQRAGQSPTSDTQTDTPQAKPSSETPDLMAALRASIEQKRAENNARRATQTDTGGGTK